MYAHVRADAPVHACAHVRACGRACACACQCACKHVRAGACVHMRACWGGGWLSALTPTTPKMFCARGRKQANPETKTRLNLELHGEANLIRFPEHISVVSQGRVLC